jgi:putative transposase
MYIQGVSTRKVTAISEELCGHSFSASAISEINKKPDSELGSSARRELESEYPYLILDARYEKATARYLSRTSRELSLVLLSVRNLFQRPFECQ